ncbi:MAG: DUF4386 domain-containing protein [Acidobacteriota bacterium]
MPGCASILTTAPVRSGWAPPAIEPAQLRAARVLGFLYVLQMAVAVFGQSFVRQRLIVADPVQTAQNIVGSERLFRLSIAGDLFVYAGVIVLAWAFYVVVRPVDRNLALLAVLFRLAETAVLSVATIQSLVALRLLSGAGELSSFSHAQLQSLVKLALHTQGLGMSVGFILLGLGSTVFAWLLWKSRYVPRVIAGWGIFSSLLLAAITMAALVFPGLGTALGMTYMAPMGLYEVGLGVWLLVKGIEVPLTDSAAPN